MGLCPAVISAFVLSKLSRSSASYYFLTGVRFDAATAQRIGLLHNCLKDEAALDEAVKECIKEINSNSPAAVRASKALIQRVEHDEQFLTSPQVKRHVTSLIASLRISPEGQEGITSFLEKRKAGWNLNLDNSEMDKDKEQDQNKKKNKSKE